MQYSYSPECHIASAVTPEDLASRFETLDDILIVQSSNESYIQTRLEASGFLVEYQHAGVQYECTPAYVTREQALAAFIAYVEHGVLSNEFLSSLKWIKCNSYQPGDKQKEPAPKELSEDELRELFEAEWKSTGLDYSTFQEWNRTTPREENPEILNPVHTTDAGHSIFEDLKKSIQSKIDSEDISVSAHTTGIEFEEFVARTLQRDEWIVRLTKKSGDQGLDLLARDEKYRIAIQCKRYSSPVGNSAVQEVHAAADFSNCTHAVVVATAGFTKAATELAEALGVILLAESDLRDIRSHLAFTIPRQQRKGVSSIFRD